MLPDHIERAIYGLVVTPSLHLADKYDMFTHLLSDGPLSPGELAARISADPDTVERLLLVLTSAGLLQRDDAGRFRVEPASAPFVDRTHPRYVGGFVTHLVDVATGQLGRLEQYLLKGKAAVEADLPEPYDRFYADPASTSDFMDAMWSLSYGVSQELVALVDLTRHRTLADIGGASGPFAVAALERNPQLRATVFDLPDVEPHLRRSAQRHDLTDRLTFVAGDFFRDELPPADVLAFGYVMSNWPDAECRALLAKAARSCAPGGKVLIMDRLFDPAKDGPLATSVMNLTMQVETHGVHRTAAEFVEMLTEAGFVDADVRHSTMDKHLVIGHKPENPH
jgi:ubiquinone/menaquinone biosynthesis C-methylase UbiE